MKKFLLVLLPLSLFILSSCSKDFGTVEVTYTKATAVYGDLNEIRNTPLLESEKTIVNPGKVFVSENLLLVGEEGEGIHLVDNSDPENPTNLSFLNIPGNREFYVQGNILYAESHYDMLKIDISNKMQPRIIARVDNAFASELVDDQGRVVIKFDFEIVTEKVGPDSDIHSQTWGDQNFVFFDYTNSIIPPSQVPVSFAGNSSAAIGSVNRIAVTNNHVYVISRSTLTAFKDDGSFERVFNQQVGWNMETIYPNGNQLFVGTQQSMEIFDISNPERPSQISSFWHANSCDPVLPSGDVAFVTLRTGDVGNCPGDENSLIVVDITNLTNLVAIQEIEMESPFGMSLAGSKLYVGEGSSGLKIFDATDKKNLKLENWDTSIEAYDIIHHPTRNDLLLIAGPTSISQYKIDGVEDLSLLSTLNF